MGMKILAGTRTVFKEVGYVGSKRDVGGKLRYR
jgi:hypothetical protein